MRFRSLCWGFGPTLGFNLLYLGLMVLLPISALVLDHSITHLSAAEFWQVVSEPGVASFKLSFLASLAAR